MNFVNCLYIILSCLYMIFCNLLDIFQYTMILFILSIIFGILLDYYMPKLDNFTITYIKNISRMLFSYVIYYFISLYN